MLTSTFCRAVAASGTAARLRPALIGLLLGAGPAAQAQQPAWTWRLHTAESSPASVQQVAQDAAGNSYVTGWFTRQLQLGSHTLQSAGGTDIFIAKISADGQWQWAVAAGGTSSDAGQGIAVAADGSITVAGSFAATAQFGPLTAQSNGGDDVFVGVLSASGEWRTLTTAGGPEQDQATALALDARQQAVVAGRFRGSAAFGATTLSSQADSEAFLAKLSPQGGWQWARQSVGQEQTVISSLGLDAAGSVYAAGYFAGTTRFGHAALTTSGTHDAFVAKASGDGRWQWATAAGGPSTDYAQAIAVSPQGNVFVTGSFSGQASFGSLQLSSRGGDDAYVARLSAQGGWQWVQTLQGPALEEGRAICIGPGESLYVAGRFSAAARYGPTGAPACQAGTDGFVARLTSEGQWLDFLGTGGPGADAVRSLTLGLRGQVLVGGVAETAAEATAGGATRLRLFAGSIIFPVRITADTY
ncbi:SBBP repeat-containing protein [Hymenobacter aquaticus]|nr:SBBP repeat-containing protein [Hymenobacter aquaticus]